MLRRSMPWLMSTQAGLMFVSFGKSHDAFEAQMRLWHGAEGHMSYGLQEAIDQATGETLPNSPRHMGKARVSAPLFGTGSSLAVEVLAIGSRQTLSGNWTGASTTANVTLVKPLGRTLEIFGTVRNLFDVDYAVPASSEHGERSPGARRTCPDQGPGGGGRGRRPHRPPRARRTGRP